MSEKKYVDLKKSARGNPKPLLPHAASLTHFRRQGGHPANMIALQIEAAFGTHTVTQENLSYQFKLKRCYIDVSLRNCSVSLDPPKYRRFLSDDDYKIAIKKIEEQASRDAIAGSAKGGLSLPSFLFPVKAGVSGEGELSRDNKDKQTHEITSNSRIQIVQVLGAERWQIGHETLGDPLNNGFLFGDYLSDIPHDPSSVNKLRDPNVLCGLCLDDNQSEMTVVIELRAEMGDFFVIALPSTDDADTEKIPFNQQLIEQIYILKNNQIRQRGAGIDCGEHELLLARCTLKGNIIP